MEVETTATTTSLRESTAVAPTADATESAQMDQQQQQQNPVDDCKSPGKSAPETIAQQINQEDGEDQDPKSAKSSSTAAAEASAAAAAAAAEAAEEDQGKDEEAVVEATGGLQKTPDAEDDDDDDEDEVMGEDVEMPTGRPVAIESAAENTNQSSDGADKNKNVLPLPVMHADDNQTGDDVMLIEDKLSGADGDGVGDGHIHSDTVSLAGTTPAGASIQSKENAPDTVVLLDDEQSMDVDDAAAPAAAGAEVVEADDAGRTLLDDDDDDNGDDDDGDENDPVSSGSNSSSPSALHIHLDTEDKDELASVQSNQSMGKLNRWIFQLFIPISVTVNFSIFRRRQGNGRSAAADQQRCQLVADGRR